VEAGFKAEVRILEVTDEAQAAALADSDWQHLITLKYKASLSLLQHEKSKQDDIVHSSRENYRHGEQVAVRRPGDLDKRLGDSGALFQVSQHSLLLHEEFDRRLLASHRRRLARDLVRICTMHENDRLPPGEDRVGVR
jgi:hypothetical protein